MISEEGKSKPEPADVIIIGAGLCGSCTALELAKQGLRVTLLDQDVIPMNRAGRRNEGKIHLGLIYAADPSFSTAKLQLRGALTFHNLLHRWLGDDVRRIGLSNPFTYLVAEDSILSADKLMAHYQKVESEYRTQLAQSPELNYLGSKPDILAMQIDLNKLDRRLNQSQFSAAFQTNELAIDTDGLADSIVKALRPKRLADAPSVTMVLGRYGDVVVRSQGDVYLSWYPGGLRGWSDELLPPREWDQMCSGGESLDSSLIIDQTYAGIVPWYPDIEQCAPYQVDAGIIVAYGQSDVDDLASGLHERTRIGVSSTGQYHSVDPGKLTTAPLFAMQAAERVVANLR